MSTQVKPIAQQGKQEKQEPQREQVQEREKQKDQEAPREKSVPDVEVKQVRKEQETLREVSAEDPLLKLGKEQGFTLPLPANQKIEKVEVGFDGLQEGRIVHYLTPNTWRPNARGQVRAALVLFCYRDVEGKPTGTVNLCIFLNGPMDTGDMGGAKTRCTQFEPGVKFGGAGEPEPGTWSWPSRS